MDKKLEARVARLEKFMNRKPIKNEEIKVNTYDGPGLIVDQGKLRDMVRVWGDGLQNTGLSDAIRSGAGNDHAYVVRLNNGEYWAMDDEDIIEIFDECSTNNKLESSNVKSEDHPRVNDRRIRKALDDIYNATVVLSDERIIGQYIDDDSVYDFDSLNDDLSDILKPIASICHGLGIEDEWTYRN